MTTPRPSRVPDAVWSASPNEQLTWFQYERLEHPMLTATGRELLKVLAPPVVKPLVLLVGPTRVGKSTLLKKLVERVERDAAANPDRDPGRIPIAGVEAVASDSGVFRWKDFFQRSLVAVQEPFLEEKGVGYPRPPGLRGDSDWVWRKSFENALDHRQPHVFYVDEAEHLLKVRRGKDYLNQMDTLKSLSNMTHIPLLLVGTYQLLELNDLSDQLSERSHVVHFPRYDANKPQDVEDFQQFLVTLRAHLPVHNSPNLLRSWEYCYRASLGVCGVMHLWTLAALKLAFDEHKPLTMDHLKRTVRGGKQVREALRVIVHGEQDVANERLPSLEAIKATKAEAAPPDPVPNSSKPRQPGQRNPTRDPAGSPGDPRTIEDSPS